MLVRPHRSRAVTAAVAAGAAALVGFSSPTATAAPVPGTTVATTTTAVAAPVTAQADILDRVRAVPGVTKVTEATAPEGYRFFLIDFTQYRDQRHPKEGTFTQRLSLLHKSDDRPMVMYTSGYGLSTRASRSEPTQIVDGNQLSMEYRFFNTSIPTTPDWDEELTIWQAATDQHRIIEAFKSIYTENWLTTGGSKGGMTATYHRRFYPKDVSGTIPYVAPNDVVDGQDVYDEFLANVGNDASCRDALTAVQRRALGTDRQWFLDRLAQLTKEEKLTWTITGGMEQAFEAAVVDYYFAFWQYSLQSDCADVPDAATATNEQLWEHLDAVAGMSFYADQTLSNYVPYYYQAAYQMGSPEPYEDRIADLLKYPGFNTAESFVPSALRPVVDDTKAMPDVDRWVRLRSTEMLYVYGSNDPWSAEPFTCGREASAERRECYRFYVDGGNHGAKIAQLPAPERTFATQKVLEWAGLTDADPVAKKVKKNGRWSTNNQLDRPEIRGRALGRR
ncbi:PS-10 peptidase S37 [Knoellia remsis]|uniref:PS-10 peptidase S37 n=1 Tax=Knoellia remsis TaxID=407159 RepID=A0A2T0UI02_9MICO|nr:PS-10 peptidase S37 [Knoellia remsis]